MIKRKREGYFIVIASLIMLLCLEGVSASFEIGNKSHSIEGVYAPESFIKGWINISLNNEPANSLFKNSKGDSISLIDLLQKNKESKYSCSTTNCVSDYSANNPLSEKKFNLSNGDSKILGFKLSGNIISINSIKFNIQSNAPLSCVNQLKIDFFNNGKNYLGNNKSSIWSCTPLRNYGCFEEDETTEDYTITNVPYCQKIKLSESPGFKIGAWVKKNEGASRNLIISLYNLEGEETAYCQLPEASATGEEISCDINYLVLKSQDYYACIYSNEGTGEYKIKGNSNPILGCGFYGTPIQSETPGAYQIFAEGKKFDAVGTLRISDSLINGGLGNLAKDYIWAKYGSLNCSEGCVVPIKVISNEDQQVNVSNLELTYEKTTGVVTEKNFYDLIETSARIDADFQKISLDQGNFSVPFGYGNFTFQLKLNDKEVFSEDLVVERVPIIKSLSPITTASAFPTSFEIVVDSSENITKYEWDFGNNDSQTTKINRVIYTYNSTGQYELKVTVTDSNQKSSYKIFNIIVNTPNEEINKYLKKKLKDITNVKTKIESFPVFYQERLNSVLNIESLEEELRKIQTANASASSEAEYNKIMVDLLNLTVPESISITKSADLFSFYPNKENINLNILQSIGGGKYDDENAYIDGILSWNQKNIETKVTFKEFSGKYEYSERPILNIFELKINGREDLKEDFYFILRKLDGLKFKENYEEKEESEYVYIDLTKLEKTIVFSTTEEISFIDLPVFISPGLDKLVITSSGPFNEEKEETSKLTIFILILFFLISVGIIVYILLQTWYKKKYEDYLFKNRNNLYNMITYIHNAKNQGLKEKEISIKLKQAGWSHEQVRYVMKKYAGKRTGMLEIPIERILKNFKKGEIPQNKKNK